MAIVVNDKIQVWDLEEKEVKVEGEFREGFTILKWLNEEKLIGVTYDKVLIIEVEDKLKELDTFRSDKINPEKPLRVYRPHNENTFFACVGPFSHRVYFYDDYEVKKIKTLHVGKAN